MSASAFTHVAAGRRLPFLAPPVSHKTAHDGTADFLQVNHEREAENMRAKENGRDREAQMEAVVFYNLILEMMCLHFCHNLLTTQTSPGSL